MRYKNLLIKQLISYKILTFQDLIEKTHLDYNVLKEILNVLIEEVMIKKENKYYSIQS